MNNNAETMIYLKFIGIYLGSSILLAVLSVVMSANFYMPLMSLLTSILGLFIGFASAVYLGDAFVKLHQNPLTLVKKVKIAAIAATIFIFFSFIYAAITIEPEEGLTFTFFMLGLAVFFIIQFVIFLCGVNYGAKEATDRLVLNMLKKEKRGQ